MKRLVLVLPILLMLVSACGSFSYSENGSGNPQISQTIAPVTISVTVQSPRPSIPTLSATPIPTIIELEPTSTVQPSATPGWKKKGPGEVICPILLYHRIAIPPFENSYFVSPTKFRVQMQALKSWGYTSIPISLLVEAIMSGARLPPRPVVITFDDGDATVYSKAFPVMQEFGFSGVNYLVVNYIGAEGYMTIDQLKELAAAGWETGSHGMTHADLTKSSKSEWEVVQSRIQLKKLLGVHVGSFAYPFGQMNADLKIFVTDSYMAAVGLGVPVSHSLSDLYYLWRRPVDPVWDVQKFGSYLPWNSPPE